VVVCWVFGVLLVVICGEVVVVCVVEVVRRMAVISAVVEPCFLTLSAELDSGLLLIVGAAVQDGIPRGLKPLFLSRNLEGQG
jgi:hypothetical protein